MKRTGYMKYDQTIPLGKATVKIWAYGRRGRYVGRVEVNAAGLAAYSGKKGTKLVASLNWENLFKRLGERPRRG
ncbi:MAG: hypothetical protein AAB368_01465 [bacterium]